MRCSGALAQHGCKEAGEQWSDSKVDRADLGDATGTRGGAGVRKQLGLGGQGSGAPMASPSSCARCRLPIPG